jgi:hypothetical protein
MNIIEHKAFAPRDRRAGTLSTGSSRLGGGGVVDPSGGLVARRHPLGASEDAQVVVVIVLEAYA